ncbi:MAG: acetyltransferase [Caulobacteraceae bacterium]|nr:acetyltransferase [Caulobacteraceae bacterium]
MSFVVFPAGPGDAADLAHVHVTSWRETYRGLLPDAYLTWLPEEPHARRFARLLLEPREGAVTLAAANRGGIVGYAEGGWSRAGAPREAEIATLYVLRVAQGHGLGRELITSVARAMVAQGAGSLVISVLRDNIPARGFYEHLGGVADPPRSERGPSGMVLQEVAYRWPDIRTVLD